MLGAVLDGDVGADAAELVVGALIGLLKPSPPAHVVDQDRREFRGPALDHAEQLLQRIPPLYADTALPGIHERTYDLDAPRVGIPLNHVVLILDRILLMLGGHSDVLGCRYRTAGFARSLNPSSH